MLQETHLAEKDFKLMQKQWVGEVLGSPAQGRKAGVLTLIRKGLQYRVMSQDRDSEGRRISILLDRGKGFEPLRLTNIYVPNSPTTAYFSGLSTWLADQQQRNHLMGRDFNSVMHPNEDRLRRPHHKHQKTEDYPDTPLYTFTDSMKLKDLWRSYNPLELQYSYFSHAHDSFSRIDYFLGTPDTLISVDDTKIHEIAISDHAPVSLTISDTASRTKRKSWRFPTYLTNHEPFKLFLQMEWHIYTEFNSTPDIDPNIFWEAGKAYPRGRIMAYTTHHKKEKVREFL